MPFYYPDNPVSVSVAFLKTIDADPPGTWLASCKWDGWRRIATKDNGRWNFRAKPSGSGETKTMPDSLRVEFEEMDLPGDCAYDCEWVGPRGVFLKRPDHRLYVFDWYPLNGPCPPFSERHTGLGNLIFGENISFVDCFSNPGLVDRFQEQMTNPLSEGLVVRRADSTIIGHPSKCVDNPKIFKVKFRDVRKFHKPAETGGGA